MILVYSIRSVRNIISNRRQISRSVETIYVLITTVNRLWVTVSATLILYLSPHSVKVDVLYTLTSYNYQQWSHLLLNSLTIVGYLLGVFFRLWIPFLVRISTSAWSQHWKLELKLLWHHLLGFMTHPLASFQWSGLSDQRVLQVTESCLQIQKWCSYKARGVVPEPVCANKARNGPATADQGSSLASQGSCYVHGTLGWTHPPPPYPPFLLAQNLSSKRIAPTDNMRPKSDDAIWHHRWLKG